MSGNLLSIPDIIGSDPLGHLLRRLRLSPLRFAMIFFLAGVVYVGGLAAASGYLLPRPGIVASQSDLFNQLNFFIIFPAVAFYYLWQPTAIARVYEAIRNMTPKKVEAALWSEIRRTNAHPGWWQAGVLLALLGMIAGAYDNASRLGVWWYAANGLMVVILQVFRGLIFFMLIVITARHFATTLGLNRCYQQFEIPLTILPASSGGIRAVGRYALSFTVLLAIIGLNIGLAPILSTRLGEDYPFQVAAYFLLGPAGFVLPVWQAHRHMAEHRDRLLNELAVRYQADYAQLVNRLHEDGKEASASLERLKAIQETYELTRKASTWPFNLELIYQLAATLVLPFLFTILQALLGRFLK